MADNKTVFVVGAGASKEANLPVGWELKKRIAEILNIRYRLSELASGDELVAQAFYLTTSRNEMLKAAWRICDAMPLAISIDNYIDAHAAYKELELCGKLAIVRSILEAEAKSTLHFDPRKDQTTIKYQKTEQTWYGYLFQLLTENCRLEGLEKRLESMALVVFNYDRCIEHFLFNAFQTYYAISASDATALVRKLEIFHPYGTVGALPYSGSAKAIEFGATPHVEQLRELANQIKTFTEGTDESGSEILAIRDNIQSCERLVFLGFAFHPMNIDLLVGKGRNLTPKSKSVLATGYGISESDASDIKHTLAQRIAMQPGAIQLAGVTCAHLFQQYSRRLSFV